MGTVVKFILLRSHFNGHQNKKFFLLSIFWVIRIVTSTEGSCKQSLLGNWNQKHGRNEGRNRGTIPRAPNHYGGADWVRGRRKVPTMSNVLPSIQCICFRRPQFRTWGSQTCFKPLAPSNLVTPLSKSNVIIFSSIYTPIGDWDTVSTHAFLFNG